MSKPIRYKDTLAMPKSELHKLLEEGDMKKADLSHKETTRKLREQMGEEAFNRLAVFQKQWDSRHDQQRGVVVQQERTTSAEADPT